MNNWKIILTIWIVLGISVSGYFYIKPPQKNVANLNYEEKVLHEHNYIIGNKDYYKFSVLTTVVGSILIFGFGKYYKKK